MIKIAEKDKDYVYIYSEDSSEISELSSKIEVVFTTTYKEYPAIVVKKEREKFKTNPCLN